MIPVPRASQGPASNRSAIELDMQFKMGKIYHKSNIELDMTNCDVSVTSYLNFVTDKIKIEAFSVLARILVRWS